MGEVTSALGQIATAAALLTEGGRVTWQSALGQSAIAAALLTVGGRVTWQSALGQSTTAAAVRDVHWLGTVTCETSDESKSVERAEWARSRSRLYLARSPNYEVITL